MDRRHLYFVWVSPCRASVGNTLDAYLLQTNSVFALTAFSMITTLWAMVEVKFSIVESLQLCIDVLTLATAFLSLQVCFTGSVALAAVIVAIMFMRFSMHLAICYIAYHYVGGYVLFQAQDHFLVPPYPWYHDAFHILHAVVSFLFVTYYAVYFVTIEAANQEELQDGLKEAKAFRANRKALGKGHYHWITDVLNMDEYSLVEDCEKGDLWSTK